MKKTLELRFLTQDNKAHKITIKSPKEALNKEAVTKFGEKVINLKAFNNSKRELRKFDKAVYVTREVEEIK